MKTLRGFLALGALMLAGNAYATVITIDLDTEFSGATPPTGSTPWVTFTIDDGGTAGTVDFTIDASGLSNAEYISEFYFNFSFVGALGFDSCCGGAGASSLTGAFLGADAFKADGVGGFFDLLFEFDTNSSNRFGAGETLTFSFVGAGILAGDFDLLSLCTQGCKDSGFTAAAHIQGIDPDADESGWIGGTDGNGMEIPEPNILALLGIGFVMLGFIRRRRLPAA